MSVEDAPNASPLRRLAARWTSSRAVVIGLYFFVMGGFVLFLLIPSIRLVMGGELTLEWPNGPIWTFAGVFFGLQILFVTGWGKVTVIGKPARLRSILLPLSINALFLTAMTLGSLILFLEFSDRACSAGSVRYPGTDPEGFFSSWVIGPIMATWVCWLIVGVIMLRRRDRPTALAKMTSILWRGSWLEFAVALPIDIVVRRRSDDCPCATGSFWVLIFAMPLVIWCVGPALYLFLLGEWKVSSMDHSHARKILVRKTKSGE